MKHVQKIGFTTVALFGLTLMMAQKPVQKNIDINIENGEYLLTITTTDKDGNITEEEEYAGEEARKKIEELEEKGNHEELRLIERNVKTQTEDHEERLLWKEKGQKGKKEVVEKRVVYLKNKVIIEEDKNLKNDLKHINFKAFPNPNDGKFNIQLRLDGKTPTRFRIAGLNGKEFYNGQIPVDKKGIYTQPVKMESFEKGTYLIQVIQGDKAATKRVVVQ